MDPAGNRPLSRFEVGLLGLLLGLLAARHLCLYHQGVVMAHLAPVADSLAKISAGEIWVSGPRLWVFDLPLTSPLYYWLHLPLLLFRNPIIGIHLTYFFYEALALSFWVLWGLRGGLDRRLVWLSAGCLALYWDQGALVAHNMVPASALAIPSLPPSSARSPGAPPGAWCFQGSSSA